MPLTKVRGSGIDADGQEIILDADEDTTLSVDTDDQVDIKVGGTDKIHINQYGLGSGAVPIASDGSVVQATGNDGYSMRRSGQTNAGIVRPLASGDGMRLTVAGASDRVILDETNAKINFAQNRVEHSKSLGNTQREVKGFYSANISTSYNNIFQVQTGNIHLGYFYEVIIYGGDWGGHSAARAYKRGFINGYNGYTGHNSIEQSGQYGGAEIIENVTWDGSSGTSVTSTYQLKLDGGSVGLTAYIRLVGNIVTFTIN
jgi:hypothetical protein